MLGSLMAFVLLSAACDDVNLRRTLARARADSTADSSSGPTQSRGRDGGQIDPEIAAAAFSKTRAALRHLVTAEETFFAENGTYSEELSLQGLQPDSNTTIRFLRISRDGWAASGTHASLPGRDCVIFVGRGRRPPTTVKYGRRAREGVPACDDARVSIPQPSPPAAAEPAEAAKEAKPQSAPPDTGNALDALDPRVLMKVDLRNLAHSQETFFAMQGFYAKRPENLALQYLWHKDVQVRILAADAQSWTAKATHARFPGKSCVIWFGPVAQHPVTDAQKRYETQPGVPVCDQ
jgi:Tfp pilus assembly protein PilE